MKISKDGITIQGEKKVILCGSLFYFRINQEDWEDRIKRLKYAGYNTIDVYFPWNFHEVEEGIFSFEGNRDIKTFLDIAKQHEMYVVARPGPYICSEYDFGGLPGYLLNKDNIRLRDNDPTYLSYVKRYFDQILPILSAYQIGKKGTIIALQIENELDFYKAVCQDPRGYIEALYNMTLPYNFNIPVIACAGQGDEKNATGFYPDVIPTFNFYPHATSHKFEEIAYEKYKELYNRDIPLMVTETNRKTSQLRRLLASGVKLLGPYNQVGGTDFGLTNSINNWGNPLTYLTSDYNFGGLVGPKGETSSDIIESKLFAKCLATHESYFASATITKAQLSYEGETKQQVNLAMEFSNGARVYSPSNFKKTTPLKIKWNQIELPKKATLTLQPQVNRFFFHNYPLKEYGVNCTIDYALCELNQIIETKDTLYIVCVFQGETELMIDDVIYVLNDTPITIRKEAKKIVLYPLDNQQASHLKTINDDTLIFEENQEMITEKLDVVSSVFVDPLSRLKRTKINATATRFLEEYGIYRGYGYYTYNDVVGEGIYIDQASDIITFYIDGVGIKTDIAANTPLVIQTVLPKKSEIVVKTEIWGHTNFHDDRLPALKLDAKRGIHQIYRLLNPRQYKKGMEVANDCILVSNQTSNEDITINGNKKSFNMFHQVISLRDYRNETIMIQQDSDLEFTIYDIEPIPLHEISYSQEEEIIRTTQTINELKKTPLPFHVKLGEEFHIMMHIADCNNQNQYLKIDAESCQVTVVFKNEIVGRLLFNKTDKMRMTGGSPDTVYLPAKWFDNEVETVHMVIEGLDDGILCSIERYVVKSA